MANKLKYSTGSRIGKWTVIQRDGNTLPTRWLCKCDCGTIRSVSTPSLTNGSTSCGLCKRNTSPMFLRKHSNRLYHAWSEMKRRCNGGTTNEVYYKGKGISYCEQWEDFDEFVRWSISVGYENGLEIDRIDGDKGYCPENCRWVSHKQNSRNRKARKNNSTGCPGVQQRIYKSGKLVYRVSIETDEGRVNVGTFYNLETAIKARKDAEMKYWGFNIGE